MSKKFIMTALLLGAIMGGLLTSQIKTPANTELSPKVAQLVGYIRQNNHSSAEDVLKGMSVKEKDEFLAYIRQNTAAVPPLYYIKMADYVFKTNKDEAALWYYIGKVRAYEDVMACKDKTSQAQLEIYPMFAPKTVKYISSRAKDRTYIADLMQKTLDWDIKNPNRVSPIWACYQGMGASIKTPELVSEQHITKSTAQVRDEVRETIKKYRMK